MQINLVDLVLAMKKKIYDELLEDYKNVFNEPVKYDNEIADSIKFYQSLNKKQQGLVFNLIENSSWNTMSSFLAWLDGTYLLENQPEHVNLKYDGETKNLNGYLSDIWVEMTIDKTDIDAMREVYNNL